MKSILLSLALLPLLLTGCVSVGAGAGPGGVGAGVNVDAYYHPHSISPEFYSVAKQTPSSTSGNHACESLTASADNSGQKVAQE